VATILIISFVVERFYDGPALWLGEAADFIQGAGHPLAPALSIMVNSDKVGVSNAYFQNFTGSLNPMKPSCQMPIKSYKLVLQKRRLLTIITVALSEL